MKIRFVKSLAMITVLIMLASALTAVIPAVDADGYESAKVNDEIKIPISPEPLIASNQQDKIMELPDHLVAEKIVDIYIDTTDVFELDALLVQEGLNPTGRRMIPGLNVLHLSVPQSTITKIEQLPSVRIVAPYFKPVLTGFDAPDDQIPEALIPQPRDSYTVEEHKAINAWSMGYDGTGVKIALLDSGVDFGHPDLQGRQARVNNPASPYDGWPLVFDVSSVEIYENTGFADNTWYTETYGTYRLGDFIYFDGYKYNVSEIPSNMSYYRIGYHPDSNLATYYGEPVAVLVVLNLTTGASEKVYVDLLNDKTFNNDKPCMKGDEISYFDVYNENTDEWNDSMWNAGDGIADISGGMIYWISDGVNSMPLADVIFTTPRIPSGGEMIAFVGEFNYLESHGTGTASSAVGTGRTIDGLLSGMAPNATVIAVPVFGSGSIIDCWSVAAIGYDGVAGTGDEANIASNSYGFDSTATESGNDAVSGWNYLIAAYWPGTLWMWSTGNGGPGYGTSSGPTHPLAVMVGAATSMGYRYLLGQGATDDAMYGDVIPFSDDGPTKAGKLHTDVVAAGAYGFVPAPLYFYLGAENGNDSWMTFGGTSMSCPVAAGAIALMYQAYFDANGVYPSSEIGKALIMSSADDINTDVLKQGAGYINAERGVLLASGTDGISIEPVVHANSGIPIADNVWYPGGYRSTNYLTFPDVVFPGDVGAKTFNVVNHNVTAPVTVTVSDAIFTKTSTTDLNYATADEYPFFMDITGYIPAGTDLTRITAYCSYDDYFDPGRTYSPIFNYGLELHNWIDLDNDSVAATSEFNRVTVDGGVSNILQVLMHDPLTRIDDGLYLRMTVYWGGQAGIDWNFRIENYEKTDWTWVSELLGTMNIPAGGTMANMLTLTLPANAPIGTYEGAVYLTADGNVTVMPILLHVAANDPEFQFGGNLLDQTIFDNNVSGTADREWRYEVGNWRTYYTDVPDAYVIGPDDRLYVTVNWSDVPTDIDVHMLSNVGAPWLINDEPFHLGEIGGSEENYLGAGTFAFKTSTGFNKEVVAVPFSNGLNEIVLRNPIGAGLLPYELITGVTRVFNDSLSYSPGSIVFWLNIPAVEPKDKIPIDISPGALSGMTGVPFSAKAFGPISQKSFMGLTAYQGSYTDTYFELTDDHDYLKVTTTSVVGGLDIDLEVYWYDPIGNDWWLMGMSAGATADETVQIHAPPQGTYAASVYGYTVPGVMANYDLFIEYPISTTPFEIIDVPATVNPWTNFSMNFTYDLPYAQGMYIGYVSFGFWGAGDSYRIPVYIILLDKAAPVIEPIWPTDGEVINDPMPIMQLYFNDTAAYSGIGGLSITLDGMWPLTGFATISNNVISVAPFFELSEGMHWLDVDAVDNGGNFAPHLTLTFYVDTFMYLDAWMEDDTGTLIPDGSLTREASIYIVGFTEPEALLTVNG
ncbi:MAG: S8 family serine peptidase, partial [Thermoplasmata archaeon]|nr:S8 family serine peptidase [Thermoplasmata archaeon]